MGIIVGFVVGYVLGARAGRETFDELSEALKSIAGSAEFQALLTVGTSLLTRAVVEGGLERGRRLVSSPVAELVGDQVRQVVTAVMGLRKAA